MCTMKEHRHVSQQNRITSKTNKIPLNPVFLQFNQFYFQINEYFFYKDYRISTMYIKKKTFEGLWLSTAFEGKTEEVKN